MIAFRFIIVALAMLLPSYAFSEDLGKLRITLIEEEAHVYAGEEEEWLDASANMPLKKDDGLWVPDGGRVELHVRGGAFVRLDGETALDVLEVGDESVRFYLDEGRLYINSELEGDTSVLVETPSSSVRVPGGSIVMLYVSSAKTTRVSALKGHADVESRHGEARVNAGSSLDIGDSLHAGISPVGDPGEWEKWNRRRDRDVTGPFESARYLPEELHEYAYDFDDSGTWLYVKEYGHVWRPSISVSIGWAPYRHGRWAWVGGDYVWISYERWGWVPYHYGRWAYVSSIGWCWLPPRHREVYWGPGFVAWVYTPTYVAWAPLAPGEIYYGRRYYGPGSVSIVNIDINKTVINHYHRNVYVKNAVTVIHRDTFVSGKKAHIKLKRNPFFSKKRSFGPPDIRPMRHKARRIAMKGYGEKRFRERLQRRERENLKRREWPRKDDAAGAPIIRRSHKAERPAAKIERRGPEKLLKERRHGEVKGPSKLRPERQEKESRIGKPETRRPEILRGAPEKRPRPELRKPMAPGPQTYEKRQPKAAKPAKPEIREKRRAPRDDERAVKRNRGRPGSAKDFYEDYKDERRERKERPEPSVEFRGRGGRWR